MQSKEDLLLQSLMLFYRDPLHARLFKEAVVTRTTGISLRVLDWLVTNYSKKHNVRYSTQKGEEFHLFHRYKITLKAYTKRLFDPFARRARVKVGIGDTVCETTLAQLAFIRWCIQNDVLQYAQKHHASIESDMLRAIQHRYCPNSRRNKRRTLSQNNTALDVRDGVSLMLDFV